MLIRYKISGLALIACTVTACDLQTSRPQSYSCPDCNIVLISMDTLRADHVGAYGYKRPTTPNIDALAEKGVLFENAISQSSWTRPAHMSMFTGLHPAEHGYIALADRGRLSDDVPMLAEVLADNGYTTAAFTGGVNMAPAFGFDRGFEMYRVNGRVFRDSLEEFKLWMEEHADRKFFLLLHGYDPHTPYHSDPIDRAALGLDKPPPGKRYRRICKKDEGPRNIRPFIAEYDGGIHRGDRYVGKFLAHMAKLSVLDKTVVIFTSDHGEEFLEHGRCFHLTTLYREVLHVPLIVTGPGIEARRIKQLVPASVSIAPTILDIAGIADHPIPGPSLAAALSGQTPSFDTVQSETSRRMEGGRGQGHLQSLTGASEKLIHWITLERYDYFDLRTDPRELSPIEEDPRMETMKAALAAWREAHDTPAPAHEETPQTEKLEKELRSLGYVD